MIKIKHLRGRSLALVAACAAGIAAMPATANAGFFDQLFGGGAPAPQVPEYQPSSPGYVPQDDFGTPLPSRHHARKKVAAVEKTPVRQKTTPLMEDKTLRPGDAVMMKTGLHIYDGPAEKHHDSDQFVALDEARHLPAKERDALVAMDTTRRAIAISGAVQEGRSAAEKMPISVGYKITDAHGQLVRYVGP